MNEIPYTEVQFDALLVPQTSDTSLELRQAMTQDGTAPEHLHVLTDDKTGVRIYELAGPAGNNPVPYRSTGTTVLLNHDGTDPDIHIPIPTT